MTESLNVKTCCFIGHRKINQTQQLKDKIFVAVENLILNEGVKSFLFGSKSEFDTLCKEIVTELKKKYPDIQRTYVRAEFEHINDSYKDYLLGQYDDTVFHKKISKAGKASYVERKDRKSVV